MMVQGAYVLPYRLREDGSFVVAPNVVKLSACLVKKVSERVCVCRTHCALIFARCAVDVVHEFQVVNFSSKFSKMHLIFGIFQTGRSF